jgi:hypothetical protein
MQANIEEEGFKEPPTEIVHRERMKELMCFLWDNYLEMHESEHIVLMGVGDSYIGVRELLVNRGKAASLSLFLWPHTDLPTQNQNTKFPSSLHSSPAL